ncbi:MAG: pyridoxamine 5'-phosphate oxidase family protein [Clostridia bacterium]|nr:pyridoxamine 5'-phosphate oxidase family protein [Clostridia bacterium]
MQEVYDFLKKCGTYYLATVEGTEPKVRPFGTINIFDGKLYIQTGKVKPTYRQIKANPNVEISAFINGQWIRLKGKLVEDDRREAKKSMLDAYPELRGMYNEDDGNTVVFYFEDAVATFYSFGGVPKEVRF